VLGAHPDHFEGRPVYNHETPFHEPFVLFGYLAAVTRTLELVTGVLILPQRQTARVAKQAAAVDVLSGGRLRLGLGAGWNHGDVGAEGRLDMWRAAEDEWATVREGWRELGATHLCLSTMGMGLGSRQAHIDTIRSFAEGIGAPDLRVRA